MIEMYGVRFYLSMPYSLTFLSAFYFPFILFIKSQKNPQQLIESYDLIQIGLFLSLRIRHFAAATP